MITLLARLFLKPGGKSEADLRKADGVLCGAAGIGLNILLFLGKFFAGTLAGHFTGLMIYGWAGILEALFILWSGFNAAKDTINPLLGTPPTHEFVEEIKKLVMAHPAIIGIHDFRMVAGPTHTNVIFDAVVPFGFRLTDDEVAKKIQEAVRALDGNYYAVVTVERSYT